MPSKAPAARSLSGSISGLAKMPRCHDAVPRPAKAASGAGQARAPSAVHFGAAAAPKAAAMALHLLGALGAEAARRANRRPW